MAIKQTLEDSKARLDALLEFANQTTGESDANIGDAIKTLVDGFGQGGSGGNLAIVTGELTIPEESYSETFWHNLGKVPLYMHIWLEEDDPSTFAYIANRCVEAIWKKDGSSLLISSGASKRYNVAANIQKATVIEDGSHNSGGGCFVSESKMIVNGNYKLYAAKYKWEAIYEVDGGGVQLPGKTVEIDGACEIYVGDLGDYGYGVRIDPENVGKNYPMLCQWNPTSCNSLTYLRNDNNPSSSNYKSYWSYDATTHTFKYNGSTQNSFNMRGTWQFIPYTVD